MKSVLLGLLVGSAVVGSSVQRTISVSRGNITGAIIHAIINSVAYFFSIVFLVKEDLVGYISTCIGSTVLMAFMAYKNKIKNFNGGSV